MGTKHFKFPTQAILVYVAFNINRTRSKFKESAFEKACTYFNPYSTFKARGIFLIIEMTFGPSEPDVNSIIKFVSFMKGGNWRSCERRTDRSALAVMGTQWDIATTEITQLNL